MEDNKNQQQAAQNSQTKNENPTGSEEVLSEFYNTSRIGRRNALGDILKNEHCATNAAEVTNLMQNCVLATNGKSKLS
jgi:hypothetical protein